MFLLRQTNDGIDLFENDETDLFENDGSTVGKNRYFLIIIIIIKIYSQHDITRLLASCSHHLNLAITHLVGPLDSASDISRHLQPILLYLQDQLDGKVPAMI